MAVIKMSPFDGIYACVYMYAHIRYTCIIGKKGNKVHSFTHSLRQYLLNTYVLNIVLSAMEITLYTSVYFLSRRRETLKQRFI